MIKTLNQLSLHYVKNEYLNNTQQLKSKVFRRIDSTHTYNNTDSDPTPTSI